MPKPASKTVVARKEPNPDKIGALWKGKTKDGKTYLSGEINGERVVAFQNSFKEEDKHPDLIVYKSKPLPERTVPASDDDIPF